MNSNPLIPVLEAYQVSMECFQLAKQLIKQRQVNWLANTQWLSQPQALSKITQAIDEVDDLFAFSLWTTFERFVITYLQDKGATLQTIAPLDLAYPLYEHFRKEVEFWPQKEVLDLLKHLSALDKNLIGQAKQILDYRNWIAHGKDVHRKSLIKAMTPVHSYQILNEIVEVLLSN